MEGKWRAASLTRSVQVPSRVFGIFSERFYREGGCNSEIILLRHTGDFPQRHPLRTQLHPKYLAILMAITTTFAALLAAMALGSTAAAEFYTGCDSLSLTPYDAGGTEYAGLCPSGGDGTIVWPW
eukprot:COSAG04_NODE_5158_length_1717_cov_6.498764_2_plen_125_part_00